MLENNQKEIVESIKLVCSAINELEACVGKNCDPKNDYEDLLNYLELSIRTIAIHAREDMQYRKMLTEKKLARISKK